MTSILVVNDLPPWSSRIGARRPAALCSYLSKRGWSVQMLTRDDRGQAILLEEFNSAGPSEPQEMTDGDASFPGIPRRVLSRVRQSWAWERTYSTRSALTKWPDSAELTAWRRRAPELLEHVTPTDLVVSSAPVWSAHLIASRIARRSGAAWVPDYRDLWSNSTYYDMPRWRRIIDQRNEVRLLKGAVGATAATPTFASELKSLMPGKAVVPILNGFDRHDFEGIVGRDLGNGRHLVHAGVIYPGRRDPAVVIQAMAITPELADVKLHLVGDADESALQLATELGIRHRVIPAGRMARPEALAYVAGADAALLLTWNDRRDAGVVPGKLFEYIGMRKPIVSVGYSGGDLLTLLDDYGCYTQHSDPVLLGAGIAEILGKVAKDSAAECTTNYEDFDRLRQLDRWHTFLEGISR